MKTAQKEITFRPTKGDFHDCVMRVVYSYQYEVIETGIHIDGGSFDRIASSPNTHQLIRVFITPDSTGKEVNITPIMDCNDAAKASVWECIYHEDRELDRAIY